MLISRNWLESLLAPEALAGHSDADLGEALTSLGLEIEGVSRVGDELAPLLVGRVDEVQPHPKADRLRLVSLFDGKQIVPVVCGAPNVPPPGGRVVFAPVGATLPGGLQIAAREIRGVGSQGMICSEQELQIGPDGDGIIVLPSDWEPGALLVDQVPGARDTLYELSVTPNRPDALGHVGVAKDLAVKLGVQLRLPQPRLLAQVPELPELVTLSAPQRCGRYLGRAYEGASVGPSPLWLRVRLHRLGLRPINNVVDITNFVLMEWGQPLHAFDRARLDEGRVVVRTAAAKETLRTLDERDLELTAEDLVIADAKRPQALAGVMGGEHSGTEAGSRELLLEAAWFHPAGVRRTARAHQISTDSSHRFERGVDHGAHLTAAAARADALIVELTGARAIGGIERRGELPVAVEITLRPARVDRVLGMSIDPAQAKAVLEGLEVQCDDLDPDRWVCRPPTHRPDLLIEEDLIEELMRHHGLEDLPSAAVVPSSIELERTADDVHREGRHQLHENLLEALRSAGLHEHMSFAFTSAEALEPFEGEVPLSRGVWVGNPMRAQTSVMRTHMLPGLMDALALNLARHGRAVRLFEVGRIYAWPAASTEHTGPTAAIDAQLPQEWRRAAILMSDGGASEGHESIDGSDLTGTLLHVLERIGVAARIVMVPPGEQGQAVPWLHPGAQARLHTLGPRTQTIGRLGEVHPDLRDRYDLPAEARCWYAELWFEALPTPSPERYRAVPRFPSTSRDLSLEIPDDLPAGAVVEALAEAASHKLNQIVADKLGAETVRLTPLRLVGEPTAVHEAIEVIEEYRGQGVPAGHRALLLRLHYGAAERSVTDTEVQALHEQVVESALDELKKGATSIRRR